MGFIGEHGRGVAEVKYGLPYEGLQTSWPESTDPQHPHTGFAGRVDLRNDGQVAPGRHWLGLRLHGRDGSVEDWAEQPIEFR